MNSNLLTDGDAFMPRNEVLRLLGYKSLHGFNRFLRDTPDFPKAIKRINAFNAPIYYLRAQVREWFEKQYLGERG